MFQHLPFYQSPTLALGRKSVASDSFILKVDARIEIIQDLTAKLRAYYVFPDIAEKICVSLQKRLEHGEYADLTEGEFFALALTMHMQQVNHDQHLWVRWHSQPLPDGDEALRLDPGWQAEQKLEAAQDNYGFHKVERLPGNVGYIDIRFFHRPEWGSETVTATMNFLANTFALIVDLRHCEGGYPGMVALISSYLFGEEPVHLSSIYWRDEDITQQFWTLAQVPGMRFGDKPAYILTSGDTFSAGEEFAYNLKSLKRARLVGKSTGGGAHPGASYRLHPHFEVFIPIGRVINPVTGTNWEGAGVAPDISVPPEQAFDVAYQMALQSILTDLSESLSGPDKVLAQEAQEALKGCAARTGFIKIERP